MNEQIRVGDKVHIVRHDVLRPSPYTHKIGMVNFVPPDGNWPFIVSVPDFNTATGALATTKRTPWPTTFGRHELVRLIQIGERVRIERDSNTENAVVVGVEIRRYQVVYLVQQEGRTRPSRIHHTYVQRASYPLLDSNSATGR